MKITQQHTQTQNQTDDSKNYVDKEKIKKFNFSERCTLLYDFLMGYTRIDQSNNYKKDFDYRANRIGRNKPQYVDPDDFVYYIHHCFEMKRYVSEDKQQSVYIKNYETNIYEPLEFHIRNIIRSTLNRGLNHPVHLLRVPMKLKGSMNFTMTEIICQLSADIENLKQIELVDKQKYVVFKNGVYKRDDLIFDHKTAQAENEKFDVIDPLPANYLTEEEFNHEKYTIHKYVLEKLLSNWFGDKVGLSLDIIRATLEKDNRHKGVFLSGDGDDGKSSFINLLINCVGDENTEQIDITDFSKPSSIGKIKPNTSLIYSTELVALISKEAWNVFKKLSVGEKVDCFVKFKENKTVRSNAVQIFATNSQTKIPENNTASMRRLIMLDFVPAKDQDRDESINVDHYLKDPVFIEYVINYVFRHSVNFRTYTLPEDVMMSNSSTLNESEITYLFVQDMSYSFDGIHTLSIASLFDIYKLWCKDTNRKDYVKNQQNFTKEILKYMSELGYEYIQKQIRFNPKKDSPLKMLNYLIKLSKSDSRFTNGESSVSRYFVKTDNYIDDKLIEDVKQRIESNEIDSSNVENLSNREMICVEYLITTGHTLAMNLI